MKTLTKWSCYLSSCITHGEFITRNVDKIAFIFKTSSGFLFQFKACIIHCFHAYFVFKNIFVIDCSLYTKILFDSG